jgi:hypothetical protein
MIAESMHAAGSELAFVLLLIGNVFKWWIAVAKWAQRILLAILSSHAKLQDLKFV